MRANALFSIDAGTSDQKDWIIMRCPNCQTINPPNAKFCLECGNRLVVCPNCGTVNLPTAKFCIECGTPLAHTAENVGNARGSSAIDTQISTGELNEVSTSNPAPISSAIN